MDVTIVGAGVIGLSTGVVLIEAGHSVRILTAEPPEVTSSAAATGMVGLAMAEPMSEVRRWEETSRREFNQLRSDDGSGVVIRRGLLASRSEADPPPPIKRQQGFQLADPSELPRGFAAGFWLDMINVDMTRYLTYLADRFRGAGGRIDVSRVESFDDVAAPVLVNCAGVGARDLTSDTSLSAAWGTHVIVENPGIATYFMEGPPGPTEWVSWMPHGDRLLIGGVSIADRWDRAPRPELNERLLAAARAANPAIGDAEVLGANVGLRPQRPSVRVEQETRPWGLLIHNYGHGGLGVTLSWGCAHTVREIVEDTGVGRGALR